MNVLRGAATIAALLAGALPAAFLASPAAARSHTFMPDTQESGTAQWEAETIKRPGLDKKHDVDVQLRPLADSRAGQIALQAGAVDISLPGSTAILQARS